MTEFYKQEFKPFYRECRNLQVQHKQNPAIVVPPMHHFLVKYADRVFPGLLGPAPAESAREMLNQIKLVVFSHHHNKTEEFLMERDVDFSVVRDTMYKYSKTSQEKFFSHPVFAFMFTYFA
mmetsp:Transcript_94094/g.129575  ORF Transcript_94094/g.129575 Transcript_94094/m.129575 type:complete len:121 (+) Transcript_94094:496-858(+)